MDDDDDDDDDGRTYKVRALELARVCVCVSTVIDFFARGRPQINGRRIKML